MAGAFSQFNRVFRNALALAALVGTGCSAGAPPPPSPTELQVHRGDLVRRHILTGELEAVESVDIKVPRTREQRLQIQRLARDGSMVSAGEVVLEFDNSAFTANLDQQRSSVQHSYRTMLQTRAQGEARLREAEAAVQRARIALAKAKIDASVPESIRSRFDHRTYQLAAAKARAAYDKAMADLAATTTAVTADNLVAEEEHQKSQRELAVAEDALDALTLVAPRDGIVVVEENRWEDRKYQVGDTVFPGWTVLGIPDLDRLRVRASLSDVDDDRLDIGMAARCTPDIEPGLVLAGTITEITPIAREQRVFSERRGFDVTIALDGSRGEVLLVPGMSVRVEVERIEPDRLMVPRQSVDFSTTPPRALRADGRWVEIEIGTCSPMACELVSGLADGDRLRPTAGAAS